MRPCEHDVGREVWVHHHNHYYGQAHLLARWCGLDEDHPPRIPGYLQHGWNIGCGWNPQHRFFDGAWRYVWSPGPARRGYALGRRHHHVIGAPWLYLLSMEPDLGAVPDDERRGTLFFLFHGWERGPVDGDHRRLVDEVRATEEGPVTFSLYWTEYERPEVRAAYEDAGVDVVCFGKRGWEYEGTDRRFLYKQLEALRGFRRVASNRVSTAVLYGLSVGCDAAVYGDPMTLEGENPAFGGDERIRRLWPELVGPHLDVEAARATAMRELGVDWVVPAPELRRVLGWPDPADVLDEPEEAA